jgi:hypothetical protein
MLVLLLVSFLHAKEAVVFDVRKTLQMNEAQTVYHDYYISAGKKDGLKNKMVLTVTRKDPFKDTNLSKIEEDLVVDVAELELLHVQTTFSIARMKKRLSGPVLEFDTVMIGDRIDLGSARMPSSELNEAPTASAENLVSPSPQAAAADAPKPVPVPAKAKEEATKTAPVKADVKPAQEPIKVFGELQDTTTTIQ